MKTIFIWADSSWAIGKVHQNIEKYLSNEFEFIYCDWASWEQKGALQNEYRMCDLFMSCYITHYTIEQNFPDINYKKCIFVSHGFEEMENNNPPNNATYGTTSNSILHLFPSKCKPFVVPNGVELDNFIHREHSGLINSIGWCGRPNIYFKQFNWAVEIAKQFGTILNVASKTPFDDWNDWNDWKPLLTNEMNNWYSTIDILLITSIPNGESETGPLPAFEAIASGVVVIGTPVGNFMEIPGPKFDTVNEAVSILNDLKSNPEKVKLIAREQYRSVVENWNYKVIAEKWRTMFYSALERSKSID